MRVFILEDDPARQELLFAKLRGHEIYCIDSCAWIDTFQPPYDLILLDHDLGGRQFEEHEDSGTRFAELIQGKTGYARIIVHSYNPAGAERMCKILDLHDGDWIPFGSKAFWDAIESVARHVENSAQR